MFAKPKLDDDQFPGVTGDYRDYIANCSRFLEVIPIENKEIVARIHQSYRAQFLKDVALARTVPDSTYGTLNSIVLYNNMDIVKYFCQAGPYLEKLFALLHSKETSEERKKSVVMFLHELCTLAMTLPRVQQQVFFTALQEFGLLSIFENTTADPNISTRIAAISMLNCILEHDSGAIRNASTAQATKGTTPLIECLINRFFTETEGGLVSQIAELIKLILDTSSPTAAVLLI